MIKYSNQNFTPERLHPKSIDRQSLSLIPEKSYVLEIGCATGFAGKYLIKKKRCIVDGVELGKDEAKEAKKVLSRVYVGDIEDKEVIIKIKKKTYDIVYSSALIEHLKDPWAALKMWKTFLKKEGKLIITTSNIAHWSMRLRLLKGDFAYTKYGLLDNTHLRFFTYSTFPQLVKEAGFEIESFSFDAVGGGYPKLSLFLSLFFPSLFAYQMVIKAKPL